MTRKWLTCAPKRFKGNEMFFARDSGLICRAFQEIGVDCQSILPGSPMEDDHPVDLIRTGYQNLENSDWWKKNGAEGVVLYGWGAGRYFKIAKAIKEANLFLVSHMDTGGMLGIFNGPLAYGKVVWRDTKANYGSSVKALLEFFKRYSYAATIGLYLSDYKRACHLKEADVIGVITPMAIKRIRKVCRIYGGENLVRKIKLLPHPVPSYMRYDESVPKESLVVAVGRWNDESTKGTQLLAETISAAFSLDNQAIFEIYGKPSESLSEWHKRLEGEHRKRVFLKGVQPNRELRLAMQRASISICTSLRESFHIASTEALCSGASIVGPDTEQLPGLKWFADGDFGTLAPRTPQGLAKAISIELEFWRKGLRDPVAISEHWQKIVHAPKIAERIINYFEESKTA